MKKAILISSSVLIFIFSLYFINPAKTFTAGPSAGRTGAPGNSTCSACHSGAGENAGPEIFTISPAVTQYAPGVVYSITVSFVSNRNKHGFQITALDTSEQMAGNLIPINANTQVQTSNGIQYLNHTAAGTAFSTWTFDWRAPAMDVGPIIFYAAGNAANNNSSSLGDNIYTTSDTIFPASAAGLPLVSAPSIQISTFPNPVTERFTIKSQTFEGKLVFVNLVDLKGSIVQKYTIEPTEWVGDEATLNIPYDLKNGLYTLQSISSNQSSSKKIVISR